MPSTYKDPTIFEDIGALADLYFGVFKMMGRRLNPRSPKRPYSVLPDELCPPPLPGWKQEDTPARRQPQLASRNRS